MICMLLVLIAETVNAQTTTWREMHKVKKKETIFGIARQYGLTVRQLIDANPEMNTPGFELKKGQFVFIPYAKDKSEGSVVVPAAKIQPAPAKAAAGKNKTVKLGVMLPLHNINGDGRRMLEYYRGVLMACDSLKQLGYSIEVHAWNTPEDEDISPLLEERAASKCNAIIGPLYSRQMEKLSAFASKHNIRLFIPFSINAPQLMTDKNIMQVYQSPAMFNEQMIEMYMKRFGDYHPVFVDCNDTTSTKGGFTFGLRRKLEAEGTEYSITNLRSSEQNFAKSFSTTKPNVVILNTGRSPELNVAMAKLNGLVTVHPGLKVTLLGYTEWMMYTKYQLENFYKFNAYIPAPFHYEPMKSGMLRLEQKYRWNFHQDMLNSIPRFAVTGFDHTMFLVEGLAKHGDKFVGDKGQVAYRPIQTPLQFERYGNGGLRNRQMVLMHYMPEHRMEVIK